MEALNGRLDMVEFYHRLGVLLAYNRNNRAGGGCHDEDQGLTDLGRAVIDEMNRNEIVAKNPQFWPASEGYLDGVFAYFSPAGLGELTEVLLRRGLDETTIRGVLGEDFARVAERAWK